MSVIIVGCGVMGLSTACALAERGYSVVAMDAFPVPLPLLAACDYNKIIRTEYTDPMYTAMSVEALEQWRNDPVFKSTYSECGRILITPEHHEGRREFERVSIANLQAIGGGSGIEYWQGGDKLASRLPFFDSSCIGSTTEVKWNPESGLAHAANALRLAHDLAEKLGVQFIFGDPGRVVGTEVRDGRPFVIAADGSRKSADQVVVCAGAATGYVVDLHQQQAATGLFVTHIELTPEEHQRYKDLPVVFDAEMGYFFPPDPETRVLKIALPGSGASNYVGDPFGSLSKKSLPRYKLSNPGDTVPVEAIGQARRLLRRYLPELSYHRLFDSKACWIADTADSHFVIDAVPGKPGLYVATGDSGHAFKFLPNLGTYIADKLEGTLAPEYCEAWRWREDNSPFDPTTCAWRVSAEPLDFSEVKWAAESAREESKM